MVLEIIGTVIGAGRSKYPGAVAEINIAEHRGAFKSDGVVRILFEKKAGKDLLEHLGITDAEFLPSKVNRRPIYIIIR